MKKAVSKISKILFVLTMIFSMSFAQISNIEAWDNTVPHEFTKVKKIKYPEWWGNKVPGLSSWSTYSTKYNGKWAYCLESSKKTPCRNSSNSLRSARNVSVLKRFKSIYTRTKDT